MHGVACGHPLDESGVGAERDDGVARDAEVDLRRGAVDGQERVDESEQLHDALVLAQVLVALEQEVVVDSVAATDGQAPRVLLGRQDLERRLEERDANGRRAHTVRTRHAQLQIVGHQELGRHVVQLQLRRLRLLRGHGHRGSGTATPCEPGQSMVNCETRRMQRPPRRDVRKGKRKEKKEE